MVKKNTSEASTTLATLPLSPSVFHGAMPPSFQQLVTEMEPVQAHPLKTGPVFVHQRVGGKMHRVRVLLSIYSSRFEHYAVLSQEKVLCKDCGFLNLKHCKARGVDSSDGSFEIISKDGETGSLTITPVTTSDCQSWITAVNKAQEPSQLVSCCRRVASSGLGSRPGDRHSAPFMPTLAEEGADE